MADMDYITRAQMQHKNLQALTSFDWEFNIDFSTYVGFHPPMSVIRTATNGIQCQPGLVPQVAPMTIPLRGFSIQQPGLSDEQAQYTVTLAMQDFEDQSLLAWMYDWTNRCNSVINKASYRRESVFVDVDVLQLNSTRVRVLQLHYYNCLPIGTEDYQFSQNKAVNGGATLTMIAEWRLVTLLNI
jgi:hypothetical protein